MPGGAGDAAEAEDRRALDVAAQAETVDEAASIDGVAMPVTDEKSASRGHCQGRASSASRPPAPDLLGDPIQASFEAPKVVSAG